MEIPGIPVSVILATWSPCVGLALRKAACRTHRTLSTRSAVAALGGILSFENNVCCASLQTQQSSPMLPSRLAGHDDSFSRRHGCAMGVLGTWIHKTLPIDDGGPGSAVWGVGMCWRRCMCKAEERMRLFCSLTFLYCVTARRV